MFKVGDKIVCVSRDKFDSTEIGLVYTVNYSEGTVLMVKGIGYEVYKYNQFKLLSEFRKQKIEKICSRLEML